MTIRATIASLWLFAAFISLPALAFAQSGSRPGVVPSKADADSNSNRSSSDGDDSGPSGPRVLTAEELAPDSGEMGKNFPPAFDPLNPPSNVRVNIDFDQAELSDVVMWISALTAQNFIIADTIASSKKITIISPQPVRIRDAYRAFIAALNMNGLTVVPFGKFLKIVEASTAANQPNPIIDSPRSIRADDRMVTYIHELQHVAIQTVQPVLDALKTESANITPYEATNTLIITETGSNLRRLLGVLERLDTPGGRESIHMYQVKHAEADTLKEILTELFDGDDDNQQDATPTRRTRRRTAQANQPEAQQSEGTAPNSVNFSQIISDPRTNQLIVISTQRSYEKMVEIVQQLDIPIPGEGEIHVVQLENANATDLAATLQTLAEGVEQQNQEGSGSSGNQRRRSQTTSGSGSGGTTIGGNVSVTADEATNSLVIVANLRDYIVLQRVIDQLDRRRDQVYVEAVIMEITLDRDSEIGLAFNGGALAEMGGEQVPIFGATSLGGLSSLMMDPSSLMGMAVGLRGPNLAGSERLFGIGLPSFGAILEAMQTDSDVNVLSTPHILTMDNEEAEIIVGENVPFVSGMSTGLGGGSGLGGLGGLGGLVGGDASDALSGLGGLGALGGLGGLGGMGGLGGSINIQRQDVALTLRITPQINSSDYVRLEIEQQIDDIASDDPIRGPTTTTRQIRTTVAVEDQQTVVLGGLMRDTQTRTVSKVPFLGDIPVIGHLFRHTSTRTVKTNLLLLLTPYIIRDPQDFQQIFRRKMREREEFLAYFGRHGTDYVRSVDYARKVGPMQAMIKTVDSAVQSEEQRIRAFGTETTETPLNRSDSSDPIRFDTTGEDEVSPRNIIDDATDEGDAEDAGQEAGQDAGASDDTPQRTDDSSDLLVPAEDD